MASRSRPVLRIPVGQGHLAPVDAADLGLGRVPGVVGVGEAHPAEPVLRRVQAVQPGDGAVGHPVGVVDPPVDGIDLDLGGTGVPAPGRVDLQRPVDGRVVVARYPGVLGGQPPGVVEGPDAAVGGQLQVLEPAVATPGRLGADAAEGVLVEAEEGVEEGLEVGLAHQGGAVALVVQHLGHRGRVEGERDPVHPHPVGARVLTGEDGRARRHAHHRLGVGPRKPDPLGGQTVDDRGAGQDSPVAPQGVVALLIGGDQQDLPAHQVAPFEVREGVGSTPSTPGRAARAARAAPPMTRASGAGSASVL